MFRMSFLIRVEKMKKEKFLFELIDNYLYMVNLGCMVMENYFLVDKTKDYTICANCLEDCLDFYDQIYSQLDNDEYSSHEVDSILNHLVQALKEQAAQTLIRELRSIVERQFPGDKDFVDKHLLLDKDSNPRELNVETLLEFFKCIRAVEAS